MYDFVFGFALGLLMPFLSVFVLQDIEGGTLKVAGLAFTAYWVARLVTTIPFSRFMDRTDGERDEFYFMVIGTALVATLILFYIWASKPWHIYLIQALIGIANSMAVPGWRILFTDHLDKGKVGLEWSFDDVVIGLATAASAYLGGVIAEKYGFDTLFIVISILSYLGAIILIPAWKNIKKKPKEIDRLGVPTKVQSTI
ncbi:MAG: MFS transporter [bacterium]|nr:MFS transporter [bacterium]